MKRIRSLQPKRNSARSLSATWNAKSGVDLGGAGTAISFDAAVDALANDARRRAARKARAAERGPTRKQLFAVANASAALPRTKAKVKMPQFSIQKDE